MLRATRAGRVGVLVVVGLLAVMAPATARAQDGPVTAYVDAVDAWATAARLQQLLPGVDPATVAADIERNRDLAHRQMRSFDGDWSTDNLADVAAFALLSAYASYEHRSSLSGRGSLAESKIRSWIRDVYKLDVEAVRLTRRGFESG